MLLRFDDTDAIGPGGFSTPGRTSPREGKYLVWRTAHAAPCAGLAGIAIDDLPFDEPWLVVDAIVHDGAAA